ncbi:hypothetical protein BDZ89DRAFT_257867, partial [Hymenopellis radicata]
MASAGTVMLRMRYASQDMNSRRTPSGRGRREGLFHRIPIAANDDEVQVTTEVRGEGFGHGFSHAGCASTKTATGVYDGLNAALDVQASTREGIVRNLWARRWVSRTLISVEPAHGTDRRRDARFEFNYGCGTQLTSSTSAVQTLECMQETSN